MPQDTLWLNQNGESFFIYNKSTNTDTGIINAIKATIPNDLNATFSYSNKNNPHNDSLLQVVINQQKYFKQKLFLQQKEYYDNLGTKIEILIFFAFIAFIFYAFYRKNKKQNNPFAEDDKDWIEIGTQRTSLFETEDLQPIRIPAKEFLIYKGKDLSFSEEEIITILNKRFPFFTKLQIGEQRRFLQRVKKFMSKKIFKIHDKKGFKEMPILISATAIQLSFGLEEYLLTFYNNINIFPKEFLGLEPTLRFLEGNVSGNSINISWKHYLQGNENNTDGQNVGLHEMAHAYYCQNMICKDDRDKLFATNYNHFNIDGESVFKVEQLSEKRLFSDYALQNLQEFWAESVELFFEKPFEMKEQYPKLYTTMCVILNQKNEIV